MEAGSGIGHGAFKKPRKRDRPKMIPMSWAAYSNNFLEVDGLEIYRGVLYELQREKENVSVPDCLKGSVGKLDR